MRRLSALEISQLTKAGKFHVGDGLYANNRGKSRTWEFRYQLDRKEHCLGLGSRKLVSIEKAFKRAREAKELAKEGKDPIDAKRTQRAAAAAEKARLTTVKQAAEMFLEAQPRDEQWKQSLRDHVYPVIGAMQIADVGTAEVLKCLKPVWQKRPETGRRVRQRLEAIFDFARVSGFREGENPARWRGNLKAVLPARHLVAPVKHLAAMPYAEIPAFMGALRQQQGTVARALEFAILNCARAGEVIGAQWAEIDLLRAVWTVPAQRMKLRKEHRVPLARRSLDILQAMPRRGDYVFATQRGAKPSKNLMLRLLKQMAPGQTVHGCRSSFRDWAADRTSFAREVCELQLAHSVGDQVERAYRRGDQFEKRRRLAEAWAVYCSRPPVKSGDVIPLQIGAA